METKKTTIDEMVYIQSHLNAPKRQRNEHMNFNYRSCEDTLEAVKPLLKDTNCTLTVSDDIIQVADRIYVKATATLKTPSGKEYSTTAFAREVFAKKGMDDSQLTGAASSYARKYALNGLFCIDDNRDADALNTNEEFSKPVEVKPKKNYPKAAIAPKPIIDPKVLDEKIEELRKCVSRAELTAVWNANKALQGEKRYWDACEQRANELNNKTA